MDFLTFFYKNKDIRCNYYFIIYCQRLLESVDFTALLYKKERAIYNNYFTVSSFI